MFTVVEIKSSSINGKGLVEMVDISTSGADCELIRVRQWAGTYYVAVKKGTAKKLERMGFRRLIQCAHGETLSLHRDENAAKVRLVASTNQNIPSGADGALFLCENRKDFTFISRDSDSSDRSFRSTIASVTRENERLIIHTGRSRYEFSLL